MTASRNTVLRLSKYKSALHRLKSLGFVRIFSAYLADAVGGTAVQVRKDFSMFGICGNKRGGYQIDSLLSELNRILGKNEVKLVVLAGAGQLGTALMRYRGFEREAIRVVAAFDTDPSKQHDVGPIPVLPLEQMRDFVRRENIRIGVIAVPDIAAQHVFDLMTSAGIRGVLNFAPINLRGDDGIVVNNVSLELELENVIYFVNASEKTQDGAA
jgi:redox-sensing transcriptional repressor